MDPTALQRSVLTNKGGGGGGVSRDLEVKTDVPALLSAASGEKMGRT